MKNIFRVSILLITVFIASLILFTSFYLNIFKNQSSSFLLSKLNLVSIDYKYIQGNLITGFSIHDVAIESEKYSFSADLAHLSINISDIIDNFKNIDSIRIENSKIFLKNHNINNSNEGTDNSFYFNTDLFSELTFRDISLNNFDIINGDDKIYFKHLKLKSDSDYLIYYLQAYSINGNLFNYPFSVNQVNGELSLFNNNVQFNNLKITDNEDYLFFKNFDIKFQLPYVTSSFNVNGNGYTYLYGYNLNIDSLKVFKPKTEKNYKYTVSIGPYIDEYFSFSNIYSSDFLMKENAWNFRVKDFSLLNEDFDDIKGIARYVEDSIFISVPYNEKDRLRNKLNKSVLGADLIFHENNVGVNSLIIKIGNYKPLMLKQPIICSILNDSFSGDSLYVAYKSGELLIKSFIFKNTEHYDFSLYFNDFDLDLFRGLNVGGILSGNLRITDKENDNAPFYATFSDAKVKNLSKNAITMDKVGLEGSISNNEVEIISIDMEKKIGPLNVSGSFSSLDNFYDKIVDNLKIKIK